MTHWKGPLREREVAAIFQEEGWPHARRQRNEGFHDDIGDIVGVPNLCVQVAGRKQGLQQVITDKLPAVEVQRQNRNVPFSSLWIRMDRKPWLVILTPKMFCKLLKYALIGYDVEQLNKSVKVTDHDDNVAPTAGD